MGRRVLWAVINLDDKANTRMRIIEKPDLMEAPALVLCKFFEFPDRRLFQSLSPPLAHKTASGFRIKRLSKGIETFLSCQICRILTLSQHTYTCVCIQGPPLGVVFCWICTIPGPELSPNNERNRLTGQLVEYKPPSAPITSRLAGGLAAKQPLASQGKEV